jgi:hypothetical protein
MGDGAVIALRWSSRCVTRRHNSHAPRRPRTAQTYDERVVRPRLED